MHLETHLENLFRTRPKVAAKAFAALLLVLLPEKLLFLADLMLRDDTIRAAAPPKEKTRKPRKQKRSTRLEPRAFETLLSNVRGLLRNAGAEGLHIKELMAKTGADVRHVRRALFTLRRGNEAATKGTSKAARWVMPTSAKKR